MSVDIEILNDGDGAGDFRNKLNTNFDNLKNQAEECEGVIKRVFSIDDFPAPVGDVISLTESIHYILFADIITDKRFECIASGVNIQISSSQNLNFTLEYTGTDTFFTLLNCDNFIFSNAIMIKGNINATLFDASGTGRIHLLNIPLNGWGNLGNISDVTYNHVFGIIEDIGQGFVFDNNNEVLLNKIEHVNWKNQVSTFYTFKNMIDYIQISLCAFEMQSNETTFDFQQNLQALFGVLIDDNVFNNIGDIFATDSKTQKDDFFYVSGNSRLPNATVKANMLFNDNTGVTTITTINVPEPINVLWNSINIVIPERMVYQDECTFDNISDTISTTFNHNLSNGDKITFVENGGLPAEILENTLYFVANVTATTFQIELSIGGGIVNFTDNGTPPNYFRHRTGVTRGWLVYIGIADVSLAINGWIGIRNAGGGDIEVGAYLIKTEINFSETLKAKGSLVTTKIDKPQSSILTDLLILKTNEGLKFYIENREDTEDIIGTDAHIIIAKI